MTRFITLMVSMLGFAAFWISSASAVELPNRSVQGPSLIDPDILRNGLAEQYAKSGKGLPVINREDQSGIDREGQSLDREGQEVTTSIGIISVVFPFNTSTNADGNLTYLRLINPESFSSEISVEVLSINAFDQFVFEGTCFISVPGKAALQLDDDYFEDCIGWTPSSAETSMFLQFDPGQYLYWQNVIWSPFTGYFGNISTCREPTVSDDFVHNVHTTRIAGYPSTLFGLVSVFEDYALDINIYDATNGNLIGELTTGLFAQNTTLLYLSIAELEQFATWYIDFSARPYHINLELDLVNASGASLQVGLADLVSHYVQQTATGEIYNMLNSCEY